MNRLLLIAFVFVSVICPAQALGNRYVSSITNTGVMYFFRPIELDRLDNMHRFEYDITYIENKDSVTINFTTSIDSFALVKNIIVTSQDTIVYRGSGICLYCDFSGTHYDVRTSFRLSYNDFAKVFESLTPLTFCIHFSNNLKCTAAYSKSLWRKERSTILRIIRPINNIIYD